MYVFLSYIQPTVYILKLCYVCIAIAPERAVVIIIKRPSVSKRGSEQSQEYIYVQNGSQGDEEGKKHSRGAL